MLAFSGCGRHIPEENVPTDMATYMFMNTPDDGIDQSINISMDAEVGKELKNKDGTITLPVTATVTDWSIYKGKYEVTYEEDEEDGDGDDGWIIRDIRYIDPDSWEIRPTGPLDAEKAKHAIVMSKQMVFAGVAQELTDDNVTDVVLDNVITEDDLNTASADVSFNVLNKVVTYKVKSELSFIHTINGYRIKESRIPDYDVELNNEYVFSVTDEDLLHIVENSAIRAGDKTSVDLSDITGITNRREKFDPIDMSMTIVCDVAISKSAYDAAAKLYYVYKLDDREEYWNLNRYLAGDFRVTEWKGVKGLLDGRICIYQEMYS